MWIFTGDAFLSIVAHRAQPGVLLVRARAAGDIERMFPGAAVSETPEADYRFRAELPAAVVAEAVRRAVETIDYDNFKRTVSDPDRHEAYMAVWEVMHGFQRARTRTARD